MLEKSKPNRKSKNSVSKTREPLVILCYMCVYNLYGQGEVGAMGWIVGGNRGNVADVWGVCQKSFKSANVCNPCIV